MAGFDFDGSPVDRKLVMQLADMSFTEAAHNLVLVGGAGSGKTHLATAIGVSGIVHHGKRVRFYSTVDRSIRRSDDGSRRPAARRYEPSKASANLLHSPFVERPYA